MSTHDATFGGLNPEPPGELKPLLGEVPRTPDVPSHLIPSPGVTPLGMARPLSAPTLPEPEPSSLHRMVSDLAKAAFGVTPSVPLEQPPAPVAPAAPVAPPQPRPPVEASTAEAAWPESPFSQPLRLDALSAPRKGQEGIAFESFDFQQVPAPASRAKAGTPFDPHWIRREFPILDQRVNGKPLVWLDNAATTQKPKAVIDRLKVFYEHENSNVHRAAHTLAARATDAYEAARESVRRTLNASSPAEIIFVRGATEGINLIAQSWGRRNVHPGDEVLITWLEHHANIVPWQRLCAERGARLRVAPVDDRGDILLDEYVKLLNPRTRLVAFTQVSNALGTITPAREMIELAHQHGAVVLLDGAQAISHMAVDVQQLDCDFYVFSGHKVFAPTGIGAVYGKRDLLEAMPPWQAGGNMIEDVTFERTVYQRAPARFEAGTGNIADAVGLGAALDWLAGLGIENVSRYEHELLEYGTARLATVPGLRLIGTSPNKAGVLSFVLAGQRTEELGGILDQEGIAIRSGHHCAQPILRRYGLEATARASLAPYNTKEDLDALVEALRRVQLSSPA